MPIVINKRFFGPIGDIMPSAIRPVLSLLLFGLSWGLVPPGAGQAADADAENWNRLRSMPREQRLALWEKLKEFDALGPTEKSAIQSLSARIAQLPLAEQANYWSVLSRYLHWVQGLSEEQRNELNALPPSERMRMVTKLRAQERMAPSPRTVPLFLQVVDFAVMSPFEMAHRIKAWIDLTPEQRAEIEAMPLQADQQKHLAELAQHVRLESSGRIAKADEDALLAKMDANPQLKTWLSNLQKKADPTEKKKGDSTKAEKIRRRAAANYYFLDKPPATVEPGRLMRFEAALPPWYHGEFDHLPPEEARRRLTILYRLIYPSPGELPETHKATNPQSTAPAPTAGTPRSSPIPPPPRPGSAPGVNPF
jgi:hypothetical protein